MTHEPEPWNPDVLTPEEAKTKLAAKMAELGIELQIRFVPRSVSRNAAEKNMTLNYKVSVYLKGRTAFLEGVDYSMGSGYCRTHLKHSYTPTVLEQSRINNECETGKAVDKNGFPLPGKTMPDPVSVFASILMDAEAVRHSGFESWAADFGLDEDSRKAEAMYNQCLKYGLRLGAMFSNEAIQDMQDFARAL